MRLKDLCSVVVRNGSFDQAYDKFKRELRKSGLMLELRERRHFTKPSEKRRAKRRKSAARRRKEGLSC